MSIEQDIYDFYEPSEIATLRTFLDEGTLTIDDVVNTMNRKKEAYVKKNHRYKNIPGLSGTLENLL